jgi:hypothetical protein
MLALVPGTSTFAKTIASGEVLEIFADGIDVESAGALKLGPAVATSIELGNASTNPTINAPGTGAIDLSNAATLDMPAGAGFKLGGAAMPAAWTAANATKLVDGSDVGPLHTHTNLAADVAVQVTVNDTTALSAGEGVAVDHDGTNPVAYPADHSAAGDKANGLGLAKTGYAVDAVADIIVAGEIPVPDAEWDSTPAAADAGKIVWFSTTTAGNLTTTIPTTSTEVRQKAGVLTVGGTGACKVVVQVGDALVL